MKYIIEMDRRLLEDAKDGYVRLGEIADAVKATAVPYNPTDLDKRLKGEWKVRPHTDADGDCDGYDVYCSECGKVLFRLLNRCFSIDEAKKHVEEDLTNFCAECGTDMRPEGDVQ